MASRQTHGGREELGPPEYLVYKVALERHQSDNLETSRTRIHKLCCLVDRHLRDEFNRDIGLPRHWYQYGETIEESMLGGPVVFTPNANYFPGQAYYPADEISESDFEHLSEDLKDDIHQAVMDILAEHGDKTAEELQEFQYKNFAPDKFVRSLGDLRLYLATISLEKEQTTFDTFTPSREKSRIEALLDEVLVEFNRNKYEEISDLYYIWDDTIRLMIEVGKSSREIYDFFEVFMGGVAKISLRFIENYHIDDEKIEEWVTESGEVKQELQDKIADKRKDALEERAYKADLDSLNRSYNVTISEQLRDI